MKKGFTLIELLAVIVILGIIATIIIPSVSKTINNSKKSSAEKSAEGFIRAVELAELNYQLETGGMISQSIEDLSLTDSEKKDVVVNSIVISESGEVTSASLFINGYTCNYLIGKAECIKGASSSTPEDTTPSLMANVNSTTHIISNTWLDLKEISTQIASDTTITNTTTSAYGLTVGDKLIDNGITYYVIGFNHDVSNGETGITFICKDGTVKKSMNNTDTNSGGYTSTLVYTYLNSKVLPVTTKSVSKQVDNGSPNYEVSNISVSRWLLSFQEVGYGEDNYAKQEGTPYSYFSTYETVLDRLALVGSSSFWWLRSSYADAEGKAFHYVSNTGFGGLGYASGAIDIVFAFCI